MTPADLAGRHPRLFHVTTPGAAAAIRRHGLQTTRQLVARFKRPRADRTRLTTARRPGPVPLHHPDEGTATLNDNLPLSERALERCLDDGLTPADGLTMLNDRVFFWPDDAGVQSLLRARINRTRPRDVLVFDTRKLIEPVAARTELSPINSGSTLRKPARRGRGTFTPLRQHDYPTWRKLRGGHDRIREVTVRRGVPADAIRAALLDVENHRPT